MSLPAGYTLLTPGPARMVDFATTAGWAFVFEVKDEDREFTLASVPQERARAVEITDASRGPVGELAAVYSSTTYGMRVPGGGVLRTSGLTWVGVHPGHRRRGLLREMIDDHFRISLDAGEAVSTLYAMETPIYGRFGYASCAPRYKLKVEGLLEVPGADDLTFRVERASKEAHESVVRAVHARAMRPGTMAEPSATMIHELLADRPSGRYTSGEGGTVAIVEDSHGPAGYAKFYRSLDERGSGPNPSAKIHVFNMTAVTAQASRRLLATLRDFDLVNEMRIEGVPLDDPSVALAKDIRVCEARLVDGLWLRILDLPAALTAREYSADADAVIEVTDEQLPANAGTWRLRISGGEASLSRTDDAADIALTIQDLSAAYLGFDHFRRQQAAGLLTERTPGTVQALHAAFTAYEAPFANLWF